MRITLSEIETEEALESMKILSEKLGRINITLKEKNLIKESANLLRELFQECLDEEKEWNRLEQINKAKLAQHLKKCVAE